jgi:hypothetical protein
MAAMVFSAMALAQAVDEFKVYLGDAQGKPFTGPVQEGTTVYVVVQGTGRYCGMDKFPADILIFDFKTGAYIIVMDDPTTPDFEGAWFRELGGAGTGLFFWVAGENSTTKVGVQLGSRLTFGGLGNVITGYLSSFLGSGEWLAFTHWTGLILAAPQGYATTPWLPFWNEGDYEYLDANIGHGGGSGDAWLPQDREVERTNLLPRIEDTLLTLGRLENNDTVIVMVRDLSDPSRRAIDQGQIKIKDTVSDLEVTPAVIDYGCGQCPNIKISVKDADENLNPGEIDYVPVFVIINPGSWNVTQTPEMNPVNNFCSLIRWGGYLYTENTGFIPAWDLNKDDNPDVHDPTSRSYQLGAPIRWYNIYVDRWIDYSPALNLPGTQQGWFDPKWVDGWDADGDGLDEDSYFVRAVLFVPETGPATGEFELTVGNLEDLQQLLWGTPAARNYKLPRGTTISFYYIDPNDFDDMDLAVMRVGLEEKNYSRTMITNEFGTIVDTLKLGWDGLYIRVIDQDANVEACCCDQIVVHICDPHNEDDSEYVILDEVSANSGIFASLAAVPLLPVWDAVAGYQLVFDDWKIESFNEDTVFVQYNSVDYNPEDLNYLGDGNPNDGYFPPRIYFEDGRAVGRYQFWDVSFAKVKVFDTQVFDGTTHKMYFVDCAGNKILQDRLPMSANVGIQVEDPDQNEEPRLRELISWKWDEQVGSDPLLRGVLADFLGLTTSSISNKGIPMKIFVVNASSGEWEPLTLRETQPGSGIFRSTTCVLLTGSAILGHDEGTLRANPGDTIMAFYQDPSNHHDISIISARVTLGGGEVTLPTRAKVDFDKTTYYPGDTVTITVTDPDLAGAGVVTGANILVLTDKDGATLKAWDELNFDATGKATVTYTLPETVKLGTITAVYKSPVTGASVQATATVVPKILTNVKGVRPIPNPFSTSTAFTVEGEPAGAVASKITIVIYDLTGAKVAELTGTNTASVTWNGGNLRNGAYIYVATVEAAGKPFGPFKGFVYIER